MRLGLFAEDNRLTNGVETHFLLSFNYDCEIPWKTIHEIERFLHLKIIICEGYGSDCLKTDFCHMEQLEHDPEVVECFSQKEFLHLLYVKIIEHFCDTVSVDVVDAVFYRG